MFSSDIEVRNCCAAESGAQAKKRVVLLGASGSIGTQTLQVIRQHADKLQVVGLAVNTSVDFLQEAIEEFGAAHAVVGNAQYAENEQGAPLRAFAEQAGVELAFGSQALIDLATLPQADIVVNALSGAHAVRASEAALRAGKVLALANKESLVVAGDILMPLAAEMDARYHRNNSLMPIDSEHGAIYQCLLGEQHAQVAKLWITASGGPFRGKKAQDLAGITPAQALKHPTWNMGAKISIDSSTLMNKGLEVIEAHHLFSMPYDKIKVVVHPQSAIHSMVEYIDGSVKAHLGTTSMCIPIQFALSFPQRWDAPVEPLDFTKLGSLDFEEPDLDTFKCLKLAFHAGEVGGSLPCIMNAANEVAVAAFLHEECSWLDIANCVEAVMARCEQEGIEPAFSVDQLMTQDAKARVYAAAWLDKKQEK